MILRRLVFAVSIIVLLGFLFFAPITIPYTLELTGRVVPSQEWVLTQGPDGQIQTRATNHLHGAVTAWSVAEVERGDAVALEWAPGLWDQTTVAKGDTVVTLRASRRTVEEARLEGALAVAQATVRALESGEREAVIEEARQQTFQAIAERDQQQRIVNRLRTLREQSLIAEEEVEVAENVLEVLMLRVQETEARIEALQVGATVEQIAVGQAQVRAVERELTALRIRLARDHITAPFGGRMLRSFASDTLLHVADTMAHAVLLPVPLSMLAEVTIGRTVTVEGLGLPEAHTATIIHRSEQVFTRGDQSFVVATARLDPVEGHVLLGTTVQCRLHVADLQLRTYLSTLLFGAN